MPDKKKIDKRIGYAERMATIGALRTHMEAERLTLEEFTQRMEAAQQAVTGTQLDSLLADLPKIQEEKKPEKESVFPRAIWAVLIALWIFLLLVVMARL